MGAVNLDKLKAVREASKRAAPAFPKASASKKTDANRAFVPRFVKSCRALIKDLEELPDRAEDFVKSCRSKLKGMIKWADENEHVTPTMQEALKNIRAGVGKWQRPNRSR